MEISNNLIQTLSTVDSPSQPSEGNPQAPKSVKKKVPGEESSFDGALAAIVVPQPKETPDLGKMTGEVQAQKGQELADQVDLSMKGKASAAIAAKAEGGAPAPTIASLFQAKAQQSANGPIAGAFVAGPDQPWGSRWVFAGGNQPAPEEIEAIRTSGGKPAPLNQGALSLDQLKKLVAQVKAQGGDESQLKQAPESTLKDLDSAIAAIGGELESVQGSQPGSTRGTLTDANGNPVKPTPNVLGGAEFLSALQGAKNGAAGAQNGNGSGMGGGSKGRPQMALAGVDDSGLAQAKLAGFDPSMMEVSPGTGTAVTRLTVAKPELQVIPGGLSAGSSLESGRLEGGLRLPKDDPKMGTDTFYPNGMPLAAAGRPGESTAAVPPQTVMGHVVPGAMMRERLTSESLRNVSTGIAGMSAAGGGEMRIRLNPGNLGELMIRVSTDGKDVGLKVQANDPAAKKIIEESLGALRDSLAAQSLTLGRVDVTIATTASQGSDLGQNSQHSPNAQNAFASFDGQSPNHGRSADGFNGGDERSSRSTDTGSDRSIPRGATARIAAMGSSGSSARAAASSRLDVMA